MMKLLLVGAALVAAAPVPEQSPFDGTWKGDVAAAKLSQKPDSWSIRNGVYTCSTCVPVLKTLADGKMHPVADRDYYDAMSVTIVDPNTVRYVRTRGGKTVGESSDTLDSDGQTLLSSWKSSDNAKGEMIVGKGKMKRVGAPALAGEHATSGSWLSTTDVQLDDKVLTMTIKLDGDRLMLTQPTGEGYAATLGGPQVPLTGDKAGTMVAIRKVGNTIVETDYRKNKPVFRFIMEPVADGRMKIVGTDLKTNTTNEYMASRI